MSPSDERSHDLADALEAATTALVALRSCGAKGHLVSIVVNRLERLLSEVTMELLMAQREHEAASRAPR